jgi:hypothetical protein
VVGILGDMVSPNLLPLLHHNKLYLGGHKS